jgi:hypothetical protein
MGVPSNHSFNEFLNFPQVSNSYTQFNWFRSADSIPFSDNGHVTKVTICSLTLSWPLWSAKIGQLIWTEATRYFPGALGSRVYSFPLFLNFVVLSQDLQNVPCACLTRKEAWKKTKSDGKKQIPDASIWGLDADVSEVPAAPAIF